MYNIMDITNINTSTLDRSIFVDCTLDVSQSSVNESSVQVTEYESKERVECSYSIKGKRVQVLIHDEIKPNIEYLIRINNIESIVGDKLKRTIRNKIVFESRVLSNVEILSPNDFEKLNNIRILIGEDNGPNEPIGSYEVQISKTNDFVIKEIRTVIHDKNEVVLKDLEDGQHYLRARAIQGSDYGAWSEAITFYTDKEQEDAQSEDADEDDIIFEGDLGIVSSPMSNITPEKFVFAFDSELLDDIGEFNISINKRRL